MKCTQCKKRDAVFIATDGREALCLQCLRRRMLNRIRRAIAHFKMFNPKDHILLSISNKKENIALVELLARIEREYPQAKLTILLVKKEPDEPTVSDALREVPVDIVYGSLHEAYGMWLRDLVGLLEDQGLPPNDICSLCRSLEMKLIQEKAKRVEATKIALPRLADDEAGYALSLLFRGERPILRVLVDEEAYTSRGFIPLKTPFMYLLRKEVRAYAESVYPEVRAYECPFMKYNEEMESQQELRKLERSNGVFFSVIRITERINTLMRSEHMPCPLCSLPTIESPCHGCRLARNIGIPGW